MYDRYALSVIQNCKQNKRFMYKLDNTFYAERGYLRHCSTNDSLTRQQCSQGLCPWTPLSRATRSVSFPPSFRTTSVVVFFTLIFAVLLKKLQISIWRGGGHRPSCIMIFVIMGQYSCSECGVDAKYQIWFKSDEPFRSY